MLEAETVIVQGRRLYRYVPGTTSQRRLSGRITQR